MWSEWSKLIRSGLGDLLLLRSGTLLQDYIIFPKPDSLKIGLSPNSSQNTRSYSLNQSVHYLILFRCPTLLLGRRTPPKLTSEAGLPRPDSLRIGLSPNSSQIHGPVPWTNPFTIRSFSGVPHYYWDVRLLLSSLPKPDFRGRTHSELGYLPIRLKIHGPVPWTNPFTIRSFSGVPHYYWDVGLLLSSLPKPDFRGRTPSELGYLPIRLKIHGSILWTNPFTIGSFSGVPPYLLGRRTTGKGIGANTHHCVSISDRMAGWPSSQLSE